MLTVPIDLCRACGRVRGELSALCASCLRMAIIAVNISIIDKYQDECDRYRMEDTVRDGDRERMASVKASFRRGE